MIRLVLLRLAEPKLTVGPPGVTPLYLTNLRPNMAHALRCQSSVTGFHLFIRSALTLAFALWLSSLFLVVVLLYMTSSS